MNLPQEPLGKRRTGFSPVFRYSCRHSHSHHVHHPFQDGFVHGRTLPYQPPTHPKDSRLQDRNRQLRSFGGALQPRYIIGAESLDQ
jgi:hypothetical protein